MRGVWSKMHMKLQTQLRLKNPNVQGENMSGTCDNILVHVIIMAIEAGKSIYYDPVQIHFLEAFHFSTLNLNDSFSIMISVMLCKYITYSMLSRCPDDTCF